MWSGAESNRRHVDFQSTALPTELPDHLKNDTQVIHVLKLSIIKYAIILVMPLAFMQTAEPDAHALRSWKYYFEKGMVQYRAGMVDYAVFNLSMCLDLNTRCFEAANPLAEIYDTSDRKPLALDFYQRSLAVNDNQAEIHCA